MPKTLDHLLPLALEATKDHLVIIKDAGGKKLELVPKQYNGAIASLGASITRSGLLAALAFYSNSEANAEVDRTKLLDAILQVLHQDPHSGVTKSEGQTLFALALTLADDPTALRRMQAEVLRAATAIKLALRTFARTEEGART